MQMSPNSKKQKAMQRKGQLGEGVVDAIPIAMFDPVANKLMQMDDRNKVQEASSDGCMITTTSEEPQQTEMPEDSYLIHTEGRTVRVLHKESAEAQVTGRGRNERGQDCLGQHQ
jgi:hypothetical protein